MDTAEGTGPSSVRSYDGFISYAHAADDLLAPRLQAGLQRFAKPWWKRRAVRIFRDESSLSANPHLWSSITEALDTSDWFVLLLSPDAAKSEWVNQEIAYWVQHRDPKKILPVVTDGTFGWADDVMTGSAVPEALQDVFVEEPRWVDMRFAKGEEQLDLNNPTFSAAVADIASAIRGVPKDELESEEVRQHRRTVRTAWGAGIVTAALAVAAVGFGLQSARNASEAERSADDALRQTAIAEQQTMIAEQQAELAAASEREALRQAEIATEEAARADRTARRLLDFIIRPGVTTKEAVELPRGAVPWGLSPTTLPSVEESPLSVRLDFGQEICPATGCYAVPSFVDSERGIRTPYYLSYGLEWLAKEPFHIRHGFIGLPDGGTDDWLADGYAVRLYVTRTNGPFIPGFGLDEPRLVEATSTLAGRDHSCGPTLRDSNPNESCVAWVFQFPEGLEAGWYDLVVEWIAPCAAWFETDVCDLPTTPIGLSFVGGSIIFYSEDFRVGSHGREGSWPFDPWANAQPLPVPGQ